MFVVKAGMLKQDSKERESPTGSHLESLYEEQGQSQGGKLCHTQGTETSRTEMLHTRQRTQKSPKAPQPLVTGPHHTQHPSVHTCVRYLLQGGEGREDCSAQP